MGKVYVSIGMARQKKWTQKLCLEALHQYEEHCKEAGRIPTIKNYKEFSGCRDLPSVGTIRLFGNWNQMRQQATNKLQEIPPNHTWTEATALDAIQRYEHYCQETNQKATSKGYDEWRKHNNAPCLRTISRYRTWNEMRMHTTGDNPLRATHNQEIRQPWTVLLVLDSIRRYEHYCQETHQKATRVGYQQWHMKNPNTPSIGTIEHHGPWNEMRLRSTEDPTQVRLNRQNKTKTLER